MCNLGNRKLVEPSYGWVSEYRRLAQYYKLPVFSYNEVLWDAAGLSDRKRLDLLETLKAYELHSPWHAHLFISDIMAGYLESVIRSHCHPPTSGMTLSGVGKVLNDKSTMPRPTNPAMGVLEHRQCNLTAGWVLHAEPSGALRPSNITHFELTLKGWTQYVDHSDVPGWIINAHVPLTPQARVLSFPFWRDDLLPLSREHHVQLNIDYLRTYKNAGIAMVFVCGTPAHWLDALWKHYEDVHVSIPQRYTHVLLDHELAACMAKPLAERVISLNFNWQNHGGLVQENGWCNSYFEARANNKFKLIHISVCLTAKD